MARFLNHFNDGLRARAVLVLSLGPETVVAHARQPIRLPNTTKYNHHPRWTGLRRCLPSYIVPDSGTYRLLSSKDRIFSRESRCVRNGVVDWMLLGLRKVRNEDRRWKVVHSNTMPTSAPRGNLPWFTGCSHRLYCHLTGRGKYEPTRVHCLSSAALMFSSRCRPQVAEYPPSVHPHPATSAGPCQS